MKALTLAELAKQVGVGVATVDRVLNDRGGVSPAMTKNSAGGAGCGFEAYFARGASP